MTENPTASSSVLANELRNVVHQAEELLRAVGDNRDEAFEILRQRVFGSIGTAKARLADLEEQASQVSHRAAIAVERYVRENPWSVVAISLGVGLLAGVLVAQRRAHRGAHELEAEVEGLDLDDIPDENVELQ